MLPQTPVVINSTIDKKENQFLFLIEDVFFFDRYINIFMVLYKLLLYKQTDKVTVFYIKKKKHGRPDILSNKEMSPITLNYDFILFEM